MKGMDPQREAQVWQRVRGENSPPAAPPEAELLRLMMEKWSNAATYQQLARQFSGRDAATLQRLSREEMAHVNCLRGDYTLITGNKPPIQKPAVPKETAAIALRKCYGREIRTLSEYERRSGDPEYGAVYRKLAQQEQEHGRILLELIGNLQK